MKIIKIILASFNKIVLFFVPALAVFVLHVVLVEFFNIYWKFPRFDIPMHFVGGLVFTYGILSTYKFLQRKQVIPQMEFVLNVFFVFTTITAVTVFWEFAELASDLIFQTQAQISAKDTMLDMFLGMTGGLLIALFYKSIGKNEKDSE